MSSTMTEIDSSFIKPPNEDLLKRTHTVYFSSSLYIINQKPVIPRTHFRCITTWVACSSV